MVAPNQEQSKQPKAEETPNADNLAKTIKQAGKKGPPPVEKWNPPFCGDLDMVIKRDGSWWYLGTPIGREALVKLFASVIRKDEDGWYLVTPVEKIGIQVEDAPFVAVDFDVSGAGHDQLVTFTTNVGDETTAGADLPIRVVRDPETGEPSPYVLVRRNLEALIDRKSFYRLVDICSHEEVDGERQFGLWSGGTFFAFMPSQELLG